MMSKETCEERKGRLYRAVNVVAQWAITILGGGVTLVAILQWSLPPLERVVWVLAAFLVYYATQEELVLRDNNRLRNKLDELSSENRVLKQRVRELMDSVNQFPDGGGIVQVRFAVMSPQEEEEDEEGGGIVFAGLAFTEEDMN